MLGRTTDRMPDIAFKMMAFIFQVKGKFFSVDKLLDNFGIKKGDTVVDYGCGPGLYVKRASELVGADGKIFAVDVHELAVKAVQKKIERERLDNVTTVIVNNNICPLDHDIADVIYALDMFHMVGDSKTFLAELNRICRKGGVLFIDDGHQSRKNAKEKIAASNTWEIVEENKRYMKCIPVNVSKRLSPVK